MNTLNNNAIQVIEHYEALELGGKTVATPYFNNKRSGARAALRVTIGKGSPPEIEEEAQLLALKERRHLESMSRDELRVFLKDHNLGVDCSGFVFHVLNAQTDGVLAKKMHVPGSVLRRLIGKLRTVENASVKAFADEKNSRPIELNDVQAGDIITMLGTGNDHTLDHVLLIDTIERTNEDLVLHYTHSLIWNSLGIHQAGIKHGEIRLYKKEQLLDGIWLEAQQTKAKENETRWRAETAKQLDIRRILHQS